MLNLGRIRLIAVAASPNHGPMAQVQQRLYLMRAIKEDSEEPAPSCPQLTEKDKLFPSVNKNKTLWKSMCVSPSEMIYKLWIFHDFPHIYMFIYWTVWLKFDCTSAKCHANPFTCCMSWGKGLRTATFTVGRRIFPQLKYDMCSQYCQTTGVSNTLENHM